MNIKVSSLYVCFTIAALLFYIGAGLLVVLRKVKNAKTGQCAQLRVTKFGIGLALLQYAL